MRHPAYSAEVHHSFFRVLYCHPMKSRNDYDKQTSGTVYVVNFGDGRDTTLTQAEMMKTMGSVKHTFNTEGLSPNFQIYSAIVLQ